ncbi:hypothetical protein BWX39_01760 [Prevotella intermedia ATCC 25611 = DSM 20706]|nr:hypothetical protein BWX39_01760 [Prevotella intermedia ATCC 25611 = DSM 20706]
MNCYRIYSFFIHKLSNAAKVINKGHLRGFSLPNVHYAEKLFGCLFFLAYKTCCVGEKQTMMV